MLVFYFVLLLIIWMVYMQCRINQLSDKLDNFGMPEDEKQLQTEESDNYLYEDTNNQELESEKDIDDTDISEYRESKPFDFEKVFLGNVFNKIGAIVLIIGIAVFLKVLSPLIIFAPAAKIILGYLLGGGLLFGAYKTQKNDNLRNYSQVLLGTGFAVLFITTYCASALFSILPLPLALTFASLLLAGVYYVADKQKSLSMIIIALFAGYLNPIFINANISSNYLFGYFILVNILSIIYVYRNRDKYYINFINLILTLLITATASIVLGKINIIYPLLLWTVYLVYDLFLKLQNIKNTDNNYLNWINFSVLTVYTSVIFSNEIKIAGLFMLFAAFIYSLVSYYLMRKDSDTYKVYFHSMLMAVGIATLFISEGLTRILLFSIEGVIIAFIAYKDKSESLINWAFGFLSASCIACLFYNIQGSISTVPVWNLRLPAFLFPIAAACSTVYILKNYNIDKSKNIAGILKFVILSMIYLYVVFELSGIITSIYKYSYSQALFLKIMTFSIVGFCYSLQTRKIYNISGNMLYKWSSYTIGVISIVLLLTCGWGYIPLKYYIPVVNIRFFAYATGIASVLIYTKWIKSDFEESQLINKEDSGNFISFYKYLAPIMGFALISAEVNDLILKYQYLNIDYLLTVAWGIYAGAIILYGIIKDKKYLKITGIWISILSILRLFFFDLADSDAVYKIIALIVLGSILLLVSYFYNRYKKE